MYVSTLNSNKAPKAIGPYSQAVEVDGFIFVSGQLPVDQKSGEFAGTSIEIQVKQSLSNVRLVLEEAGLSMQHVVKTTVLLKNMDDFVKVNEIYATYFKEPYPARACYEVARLPKDALIEIEAIARR
ncbi:MAG: RidA family protein [Sulfurospirillum sp.]|nr:RidA family protein [Sulfurospirillum sp.]